MTKRNQFIVILAQDFVSAKRSIKIFKHSDLVLYEPTIKILYD